MIISSQIIEDREQIDGRRSVRELHVDALGKEYVIQYLAESEADVNTRMTARAAELDDQLSKQEVENDIKLILEGRYSEVTNNYATLSDIRSALRTFYQTATGQDVGRMATFLLTLTDAQLRTIFNMTQAQVNQLKTRLQSRADELTAVLNAQGE